MAHGRLEEEEEGRGHAGEEDMDDEPDRPDEEWVWDTQILVCRGLHDGQAPEARDVWEHRDQI